jgi:hypothetical protein
MLARAIVWQISLSKTNKQTTFLCKIDISEAYLVDPSANWLPNLFFLPKPFINNLIEFCNIKNYSKFNMFNNFHFTFIKLYTPRAFHQYQECTQIPL